MAANENDIGASFPKVIGEVLKAKSTPVTYRSFPEKSIVQHVLTDRRELKLALPITFTPYASVKPCSARCQFCSENLRLSDTGGQVASLLRPDEKYFRYLKKSLNELNGVPFGISLSGLEATDCVNWFVEVLDVLKWHEQRQSQPYPEKILYSNGAGFADNAQRIRLMAALKAFGLHRIEFSRHSHIQAENDGIMRFRKQESIAETAIFEKVVSDANEEFDVRLVCIPQIDGIDSIEKLEEYLEFALKLGVTQVIIREFSKLTEVHAHNNTEQYIQSHRVDIARLLLESEVLSGKRECWDLLSSTLGYYFWNLIFKWRGSVQVTFEAADYTVMSRLHRTDVVYKLIMHANGNLTADWSPNKHVILSPESAVRAEKIRSIEIA